MGVFNHFPYTNIHDLNLNWVLERMKALLDRMAEFEVEWAQQAATFAQIRADFVTIQSEFNGIKAEWIARKAQIDAEWTAQKAAIDAEVEALEASINSEWATIKANIQGDVLEIVTDATETMQAQYDQFLEDYQRQFGVVQTTGTSTTDVMSQAAATFEFDNLRGTTRNLYNCFDDLIKDFLIGSDGVLTPNSGEYVAVLPVKANTRYTITKTNSSRFRIGDFANYPASLAHAITFKTNNLVNIMVFTTSSTAQYLAISIGSFDSENAAIEFAKTIQVVENYIKTDYIKHFTAVDHVAREKADNLETVRSEVEGKKATINFAAIDKYRNVNGTIGSIDNYAYSTAIQVTRGSIVRSKYEINHAAEISVITKVDSSNNFISTITAGTESDNKYNTVIDEDCYISICTWVYDLLNFEVLSPDGLLERVNALENATPSPTRVIEIDSNTHLDKETINPLAYILRSAGFGGIIRKWGFIGDSLSSGEMQVYANNAESAADYSFLDMYKYSWGQYFCRIIGAEGYNFSAGGATCYDWVKSYLPVHDDTYIGGSGGGGWNTAQTKIEDGYIIAMGVNDIIHLGTHPSWNYENGLGDYTTDIGDDYTESEAADTFVGYYASIIQRIKTIQPNAKIFCVTPIGETYSSMNAQIRGIVEQFQNTYLIDLDIYAPAGREIPGYKLNGHLSPMGYMYTAYMINTYIDWIIRHNGNDFRDTAIIGTTYRADF